MLLKYLDTKNPAYDPDRWDMIAALAEGGKKFHDPLMLRKLLPQNPFEPDNQYAQRKAQAHYYSYMGSIINLYVAWLFAQQPSVKPYQKGSTDPVAKVDATYDALQADVGNETKLVDFMKDRFRAALKTGKSFWLLEQPSDDGVPPGSKLEYEQRGLNRIFLKELAQDNVTDWKCDDNGALLWVLTHDVSKERTSLATGYDLTVETWRYYDRNIVQIFTLRYTKDEQRPNPDTDIPGSEPLAHGFKRVPIVCLDINNEICVGEQTYDAQLENFRLGAGLSWMIRRTAYAMPIVKIADEEKLPTMGVGYAMQLGPEDEFEWKSPDPACFEVIRKTQEDTRDEIYRIVHQMAQGLDNNAETVGRSADSKEIDAAATRILLGEYGKLVGKRIEETYEIISEARGHSEYKWVVEGFTGYDTATVGSLLGNAKLARDVGIPSQTFHRELSTKVAHALLPELDQSVKDKIQQEIQKATFDVDSFNTDRAKTLMDLAKAGLAHAQVDESEANAEATRKGDVPPSPSKK